MATRELCTPTQLHLPRCQRMSSLGTISNHALDIVITSLFEPAVQGLFSNIVHRGLTQIKIENFAFASAARSGRPDLPISPAAMNAALTGSLHWSNLPLAPILDITSGDPIYCR